MVTTKWGEAESVLTLYFWPGCLGRTIPFPAPSVNTGGAALHDFQVPCNIPQSTSLLPTFLVIQHYDDGEAKNTSALQSIPTIIHRDVIKSPLSGPR